MFHAAFISGLRDFKLHFHFRCSARATFDKSFRLNRTSHNCTIPQTHLHPEYLIVNSEPFTERAYFAPYLCC